MVEYWEKISHKKWYISNYKTDIENHSINFERTHTNNSMSWFKVMVSFLLMSEEGFGPARPNPIPEVEIVSHQEINGHQYCIVRLPSGVYVPKGLNEVQQKYPIAFNIYIKQLLTGH